MIKNKIKTSRTQLEQTPLNTFRITKGTKFSKAKRHLSQANSRSNQPSPNQYKYQMYTSSKKSPKFSFGKEEKFFKTRKQMKLKTQIPGPCNYQPKQPLTKICPTIPISQRQGPQNPQKNPGVGLYDIDKQYLKSTRSVKFPTQKRRSMTNPSMAPGPNQYFLEQNKQPKNNQTFSKQKKVYLKINNFPGVGEYSIDNFQQKHTPCANFPLFKARQRRYKSSIETQPGPGQYNSCSVQKYKASSKLATVIFAKTKRLKDQKQLLPGPADYNINSKRYKIKGGILTSRYFYQHSDEIPGPADYQPKIQFVTQKSISARIGKQERNKNNKQKTPSPIDYSPEKAKIHFNSTGFVFSKSKRQLF